MYARILTAIILILVAANTCMGVVIDKDFFKKHLITNSYPLDTEASAIVLYESTDINIDAEFRGGGSWYIETETVHRIIKILRPDALHEGDIKLLVRNGDNYNLYKLSASTYNLSGNDVVETKIDKSDIYEKEINKYFFEYTFSFPGLKEGSIIEYSYIQTFPMETFFPRWAIQGQYPKLISEYTISFPNKYEYTTITHVRDSLKTYPSVKEAENCSDNFCQVKDEVINASKNRFESVLLRKNIPAVRSEPYVNTVQNFMENVEFKLTGYIIGNHMTGSVVMRSYNIHAENTWEKLNNEMLQSEHFGKALSVKNNHANSIVDSITKACPTIQGRIIAIYNYVRSNFTSTGMQGMFIKKSLEKVFDDRAGSESELNLLLTAMLVHAGIPAAPLMLNTMGNLSPSPAFPILGRFNYIACAVSIDSNYAFLDASDKNNILGILPVSCYNGYARIIKKDGLGVTLTTNLVKDKSVISVKLSNMSDTAANIEIIEKYGLIRSSDLRKKWAKNEHGHKAYLEEMVHNMPAAFSITDSQVLYENMPDTNLVVKFSGIAKLSKNEQGIIYITSAIIKDFRENPFKSTTRKLPVEYTCKDQYRYNMTIMLPPDITPAELPKPSTIDIEDGGMTYSKIYNFNPDLHILTVNSEYNINNTTYDPEAYTQIRDLYTEMIKAENEMIALKKADKK